MFADFLRGLLTADPGHPLRDWAHQTGARVTSWNHARLYRSNGPNEPLRLGRVLAKFPCSGHSITAHPATAMKPSIVLVHGAFADASGWDAVIRILQSKGYEVSAVQNPLTSYEADVETTKRLIDAQTGPTVVVAHSYGGAVITAAAAGNPNVKALVYLAAFANDANEPLGALLEK